MKQKKPFLKLHQTQTLLIHLMSYLSHRPGPPSTHLPPPSSFAESSLFGAHGSISSCYFTGQIPKGLAHHRTRRGITSWPEIGRVSGKNHLSLRDESAATTTDA